MSQTTRSPARISRSDGSACGRAPFSPAATIAGNDGSAAELADPRRGGAGDLALACARSGPRRARLVGLVGEPRRLGDRRLLRRRPCGGAAARPGRRRRPARPTTRPPRAPASSLPQVGDAGRGVVEADPAAEPRGELGQQPRGGGHPLEAVADLALGSLGVAEVGDEDRVSRRRRSARPLVPVKPVSQRTLAIASAPGVAGADEVADDQLVEVALGDQLGEPRGALARSRPELLLEQLQRLAIAVGALAGDRGEHEPVEDRPAPPLLALRDVGEVDLDRRQRRRSRARRGSPSCSASRRRR